MKILIAAYVSQDFIADKQSVIDFSLTLLYNIDINTGDHKMKKLFFITFAVIMTIAIAAISLTACDVSGKGGGSNKNGDSTYTYDFTVDNIDYSLRYTDDSSYSKLKLYKNGEELVDYAIYEPSLSSSSLSLMLYDDIREVSRPIIFSVKGNKLTPENIQCVNNFIVGYDYYAGSYSDDDISLTIDDNGNGTLILEGTTYDNVACYPYAGNGILVKTDPTKSAYLYFMTDKTDRSIYMYGYFTDDSTPTLVMGRPLPRTIDGNSLHYFVKYGLMCLEDQGDKALFINNNEDGMPVYYSGTMQSTSNGSLTNYTFTYYDGKSENQSELLLSSSISSGLDVKHTAYERDDNKCVMYYDDYTAIVYDGIFYGGKLFDNSEDESSRYCSVYNETYDEYIIFADTNYFFGVTMKIKAENYSGITNMMVALNDYEYAYMYDKIMLNLEEGYAYLSQSDGYGVKYNFTVSEKNPKVLIFDLTDYGSKLYLEFTDYSYKHFVTVDSESGSMA